LPLPRERKDQSLCLMVALLLFTGSQAPVLLLLSRCMCARIRLLYNSCSPWLLLWLHHIDWHPPTTTTVHSPYALSYSTQQLILLCSLFVSNSPICWQNTHVQRCNYVSYMYTHTHSTILPSHNHRASSICEAHSNFSTMLCLNNNKNS
jgi:hypothetical protein